MADKSIVEASPSGVASDNLAENIAKLTIRIGSASLSMVGDNLVAANVAISLLTQAQIVAPISPQHARMLYSLARRMFSGAD